MSHPDAPGRPARPGHARTDPRTPGHTGTPSPGRTGPRTLARPSRIDPGPGTVPLPVEQVVRPQIHPQRHPHPRVLPGRHLRRPLARPGQHLWGVGGEGRADGVRGGRGARQDVDDSVHEGPDQRIRLWQQQRCPGARQGHGVRFRGHGGGDGPQVRDVLGGEGPGPPGVRVGVGQAGQQLAPGGEVQGVPGGGTPARGGGVRGGVRGGGVTAVGVGADTGAGRSVGRPALGTPQQHPHTLPHRREQRGHDAPARPGAMTAYDGQFPPSPRPRASRTRRLGRLPAVRPPPREHTVTGHLGGQKDDGAGTHKCGEGGTLVDRTAADGRGNSDTPSRHRHHLTHDSRTTQLPPPP
ncbi:hypothetical protein SMD44_02157 [Streptomyces alboflavus]|uniref:Uncharacterized protein n=1 Tax=Streptomyces alboflavus TaxID=67267 RepID=A0A1Z1W8K9_9ACTN|nr:hypothetical protein SMD44_02157 [Streptomyces alboflavus]